MSSISTTLASGDVIEIKYRAWRGCAAGADLVDRWVPAEILETRSDAHPLARLADGQITEIRSYMDWRLIARSSNVAQRRLAA